MAVYKLHSIEIHADGGSEYIFRAKSGGVELTPELLRDIQSGLNSADHIAIAKIESMLSAETLQVQTLLDAIGVAGIGVQSDTNTGVVAYFAKYDDDGDVASGSSHLTLTLKKGLIYPTRMTVPHGGDASISFEMKVIKDGSNASVAYSAAVALPTISDSPERFTVGSTAGNLAVDVGGNNLTDFRDIEFDFGNNVTVGSTQGDVYPDRVEQHTIEPNITVNGIDPTWFNTVTIGGDAMAHADSQVFLRKRSQDGSHFGADATTEHLKFSIYGIATIMQVAQGNATEVATTSLQLAGAEDSSGNAPIGYTSGVAIA